MARKNTCKNAYLSERKRSDIFPPFGVPLCALDLQNAAFATEVKLKKDFEKKKWHVKIHAKMPLDSRKKELKSFLPWGYPHGL